MYKPFYAAVLLILFVPSAGNSQHHSDWSYNSSVYEVNVRQYTKEGTFISFAKHLDRLQDLGVGIIWFMPIHPIGSKNRLGSLGSYYSVKDYYGINPEFGTLNEFKAVVDSIHAKGMHVVIDWVGNHTSWDNVLTQSHPEWFEKNSAGNFIPPPGTNWSDVIQLDHAQQGLRNYMIDVMKYWITETNIDGFRCDAASFVPIGFWSEVITELKKTNPEIIMIAEDDGTQYYSAGFDVSYAWSFYGFGGGILPQLFNGSKNANSFYNFLLNENSLYTENNCRLYFTSNHDENSWYGTDSELFGGASEAFIALSLVVRSIPLIYGGQETGLNHRLKFFDKDEIVWQNNLIASHYKALLQLKKRNIALWNGIAGGEPERITTSEDQSIFAFIRQKDKEKVLSVFNLTNQEKTFSFLGSGYSGSYRDVISNAAVSVPQNYEMTLPAWGYKIFEKGNISLVSQTENMIPSSFYLEQNFPNPFNPSTEIHYGLSATSFVSLKVFNCLGQVVADIVNAEQKAGRYTTVWKSDVASGLYFYRFEAVNLSDPNQRFTRLKKMIVLK